MLSMGIDPNEVVPEGGTSLTHAAFSGNVEVVRLLLEAKADLETATAV